MYIAYVRRCTRPSVFPPYVLRIPGYRTSIAVRGKKTLCPGFAVFWIVELGEGLIKTSEWYSCKPKTLTEMTCLTFEARFSKCIVADNICQDLKLCTYENCLQCFWLKKKITYLTIVRICDACKTCCC